MKLPFLLGLKSFGATLPAATLAVALAAMSACSVKASLGSDDAGTTPDTADTATTPDTATASDAATASDTPSTDASVSCAPNPYEYGACAAVLGTTWDGRACVAVSGCSCVGASCDLVYASVEQCETAHRHCASVPADASASCAPNAYDYGECAAVIGTTWNGTACVGQSGCSCEGESCTALYGSAVECQAAHSHCP